MRITKVVQVVKRVAPQIIAKPLKSPDIIRRQLSAQAIAALRDLFGDQDDEEDAAAAPVTPVPSFNQGVSPQTNSTQPRNGALLGNHRGAAPYTPLSGTGGPSYLQMHRNPGPVAPATVPQGQNHAGQRGMSVSSPATVVVPSLSSVPLLPVHDDSRQNDARNGVRMIDPYTRFLKYEVSMGPVLFRQQTVLDTPTVKGGFARRRGLLNARPLNDGKNRRNLALAMLGRNGADHSGRFAQLADEWGYQSMIWVCVRVDGWPQPVFYSHVCKSDQFHHSSFTAGGDVIGAGEWIVKNGKLLKISANSGHYRPPIQHFRNAVLFMKPAWQPNTSVLLWDDNQDTYVEMGVHQFAAMPLTSNWKTCPTAV